jgi:hypothetical protein
MVNGHESKIRVHPEGMIWEGNDHGRGYLLNGRRAAPVGGAARTSRTATCLFLVAIGRKALSSRRQAVAGWVMAATYRSNMPARSHHQKKQVLGVTFVIFRLTTNRSS